MGVQTLGIKTIGIREPICSSLSGSRYWTPLKSNPVFWMDSLDFVNNKITDKSSHPLNAPSLVKSYCAVLDGTGYFGSAHVPTVDAEVEIAMRFTSLAPASQWQGFYDGVSNFGFGIISNTSVKVLFGNKNVTAAGVVPDMLPHVYKLNKTGFYIDGQIKYDIANSGYTFGTSASLYFGSNHGVGTLSLAEIYYIKIKESGVLIREWLMSQGQNMALMGNYIYSSVGLNLNTPESSPLVFADKQMWGVQNYYHFNLQRGFDLYQNDSDGSYLYIVLKEDGSSTHNLGKEGGIIVGFTWVAKFTQDGSQFLPCETKLNFPLTDDIKASETVPYLLNAGKSAAIDIGYSDIAQLNYDYFNFKKNRDFCVLMQAGKISYFLK